MGFFKSVGHFFASIFKGAVKVGKEAETINAEVQQVTGVSPLQIGTAIAAKIDPHAPTVADGAFAALGEIAAAYKAADPAVRNKGLSLSLDEQALSKILPAIKDTVAFFEHPAGDAAPQALAVPAGAVD